MLKRFVCPVLAAMLALFFATAASTPIPSGGRSVGIIGSADGPTHIMVSGEGWFLLDYFLVAVAIVVAVLVIIVVSKWKKAKCGD